MLSCVTVTSSLLLVDHEALAGEELCPTHFRIPSTEPVSGLDASFNKHVMGGWKHALSYSLKINLSVMVIHRRE